VGGGRSIPRHCRNWGQGSFAATLSLRGCFFLTRIAPENVLAELHPLDVTCKNVSPPSVGVLG
jgi:hypothetical protein